MARGDGSERRLSNEFSTLQKVLFGKFLAFNERTEENESVWFEGELASETRGRQEK